MCGIAGFFGSSELTAMPRPVLGRMVGAIAHRGPDEQGIVAGPSFGLAHARLSIVDIASGQQPMANDSGEIRVSFNGEIFNYVELRAELIARGHRFRTDSDTEVLIRAYEEYGPDCVSRFNGDFAFALWDAREKRMMLARDRMGVRPLFYTWQRNCLFFASEVKALLTVRGIDGALDPVALDQIFTFWFPRAPRTPFRNIFELPPAHLMLVTAEAATLKPYWKLDYPDAADTDGIDIRPAEEIAEETRALIQDATRIRLRADVPVGAYLSGGLDSSIVSSAAHREIAGRLRTFSVAFESEEFDESVWQGEMAAALGTDHTSLTCSEADIGAMFPDVVRAAERPVLRTAPAPLHALSRLVRDSGFKVVLTGEGADEIFGGYDIFKEAKLRRFCARQPGSRLRPLLFRKLYPYLPAMQGQSQKYREAFFAAGVDSADPLFSHMPRFRTTAGTKTFYSPEMRTALSGYDALDDLRSSLPADFGRWHPLSQAQYLETACLLPGYILSSQGDRASMAHAVEGRFPFLDHRLVEFAARIPPRLKIRGLREKHILREAAAGLLPASVGSRPKQPYRAPDARSFTGAAEAAYVDRRLSTDEIAATGIFEPRAVEKLHDKCRRGTFLGFRDNMAFVGILSTQIWHREFADATGCITPAISRVA